MTQPMAYPGRPLTPAPGAEVRELKIARVRRHARRLIWPALILIAVAGAVGYLSAGSAVVIDAMPSWMPDWLQDGVHEAVQSVTQGRVLWAVAGVIVLLLVVIPYLRWLSCSYTVTTRRVIAQSGIFGRTRTEILHARGYTIAERRGPIQRLWGAGTLTLSNGVDRPLRLVDIPAVRLMHEALADQVEVSQILAHRDSQAIPVTSGSSPA
ncbi:MAG: PH domain-containing protein [Microbacterium sp.]